MTLLLFPGPFAVFPLHSLKTGAPSLPEHCPHGENSLNTNKNNSPSAYLHSPSGKPFPGGAAVQFSHSNNIPIGSVIEIAHNEADVEQISSSSGSYNPNLPRHLQKCLQETLPFCLFQLILILKAQVNSGNLTSILPVLIRLGF